MEVFHAETSQNFLEIQQELFDSNFHWSWNYEDFKLKQKSKNLIDWFIDFNDISIRQVLFYAERSVKRIFYLFIFFFCIVAS